MYQQQNTEARNRFNQVIISLLGSKYGNLVSPNIASFFYSQSGDGCYNEYLKWLAANNQAYMNDENLTFWFNADAANLCEYLISRNVMMRPNTAYMQPQPMQYNNPIASGGSQFSVNGCVNNIPQQQQVQPTYQSNTGIRYITKTATEQPAPAAATPTQSTNTSEVQTLIGNKSDVISATPDVMVKKSYAAVNYTENTYPQRVERGKELDVSMESSALITSVSRRTDIIGDFEYVDTRVLHINTPLNSDKEAIDLITSRINIFDNKEFCCKITYPKLMWFKNYKHKKEKDIAGVLRAQDDFKTHIVNCKSITDFTTCIADYIKPRGDVVTSILIKDILMAKINILSRMFLFATKTPDMFLKLWQWEQLSDYKYPKDTSNDVIKSLMTSYSSDNDKVRISEVIWDNISRIVTRAISQTFGGQYGVVDFEDESNVQLMLNCPHSVTDITYDHDEMTSRFLIRDYHRLNDVEKALMRKAFASQNLCCITKRDIILTNASADKFIKHPKCTVIVSAKDPIIVAAKEYLSDDTVTSLMFMDKNQNIIPYPTMLIGTDISGSLKIVAENVKNPLTDAQLKPKFGYCKELSAEADLYVPIDPDEYTEHVIDLTNPANNVM